MIPWIIAEVLHNVENSRQIRPPKWGSLRNMAARFSFVGSGVAQFGDLPITGITNITTETWYLKSHFRREFDVS